MSFYVCLGAARAGVKSLSQSMGGEWGQYGVMINNIAPGVVYSDSAIANYGPLGNTRTPFVVKIDSNIQVIHSLKIREKSALLVDWVVYMKIVFLLLFSC